MMIKKQFTSNMRSLTNFVWSLLFLPPKVSRREPDESNRKHGYGGRNTFYTYYPNY